VIKLIGACAIIICTLGMGLHITGKNKKSLIFTKEMLELMRHAKDKIEYFNAPIDEIFESYTAKKPQFIDSINKIKTDGWESVTEMQNEINLSKEVQSIINEFGNKLGKSNKQDQLSMCNYCINRLENIYKDMQKSLPEKNKVTVALCIYSGLMIIILFI